MAVRRLLAPMRPVAGGGSGSAGGAARTALVRRGGRRRVIDGAARGRPVTLGEATVPQ